MSCAHKKWYKDGLAFSCTECGSCCTGPPGYVWACDVEIEMIAQFTGRSDGKLPPEQSAPRGGPLQPDGAGERRLHFS